MKTFILIIMMTFSFNAYSLFGHKFGYKYKSEYQSKDINIKYDRNDDLENAISVARKEANRILFFNDSEGWYDLKLASNKYTDAIMSDLRHENFQVEKVSASNLKIFLDKNQKSDLMIGKICLYFFILSFGFSSFYFVRFLHERK